jgi:putative radical SAM enzyme (TIGR03279 family)
MAGNYVTLTNVDDEDLNRIIRYRMTPINISVHTTNGELRKKMLTNRFADRILEQLEKLANAGISFNAQIVLCPGVNDGLELDRTLKDLSRFHDHIGSVAIVPVGLTKFRDGLYPLRTFTSAECKNVIEQVSTYQKDFLQQYGSRLVFLSDEFYIQANMPLPGYEEYEDFSQIENGVGMVACFMKDFNNALANCNKNELKKTFTLVTGKLVYPMILEASKALEEKIEGLKINVVAIQNDFFGEKITITGLITGQDIINQLKGKDLGDELIVTEVMLKSDADIFLDDVTLEEVGKALNIKVRKVGNGGKNFVNDILR